MQQELSEVYFYLKGTLKYKRVAILFALLVCTGAWSYVFFMEDKFESKAKVHIDSATVIRPLMRGMVIEPDINSLIRIIQQLMFTRPNLEKIAQVAQLQPVSSGNSQNVQMIDELKAGIKIDGGKSDIYDISFISSDPEKAKSVVQAVLTIFSEQTQGKAISDADDAQRFVEQQIREYEQRLQQAEKSKEEFKRKNIDLLSPTDQFSSLQQMKAQFEDATTALKQASSRRDVLSQQIKEVEDSGEDWGVESLVQDNSVVAGDARIESLKDKRTQLLLKYTERHPEILEIDKLIETLSQEQERKQAEEAAQKIPDNIDAITPQKMANPYVQSLKMAFSSAEADVASAQALASSIQARVNKLEQGLNERLTIETEMKNLNRDYETISSKYAELLERREQVHITESVDDKTSRLKFKVADPPTKATKPSYPNRRLLYSLILLGSIVSGFVVAFLIYFIRPVFMSSRQLRYVTGLPSLGSISLTSQGITRAKHVDWFMYVSIAILLLGYAGVMTIEILK